MYGHDQQPMPPPEKLQSKREGAGLVASLLVKVLFVLVLFCILSLSVKYCLVLYHTRRLENYGAEVRGPGIGGYFIDLPPKTSAEEFLLKTGTSIDFFSRLDRLTLRLDETHLTDANLSMLRRVSGKIYLSLNRTNITDDGLLVLKEIPQLRGISVHGTRITINGLREFWNAKGWPERNDFDKLLQGDE